MIILGLILLAAAVVAAVELVIANDDAQVAVHMWKWTWTVDAFWLAVAGAVILAVALLALMFLRAGSKRGRRLRRERRELRAENRRLAKRVDRGEPVQEPATDDSAGPAESDGGVADGNQPAGPGYAPGYAPTDQTRATSTAYPPAGGVREAPAEGRHLER
jgi:membrane protein implicated in regulation of membrane protease activity